MVSVCSDKLQTSTDIVFIDFVFLEKKTLKHVHIFLAQMKNNYEKKNQDFLRIKIKKFPKTIFLDSKFKIELDLKIVFSNYELSRLI
jgi:hypothetical protein